MISGLPYDAEVEYLESTGTQWIDTGMVLTVDDAISCGFTGRSSAWNLYIFGAFNGNSFGTGGIALASTPSKFSVITPTSYSGSTYRMVIPYAANARYDIEYDRDGLTISGTTDSFSWDQSFVSTRNMYLFAVNAGGQASNFQSCRIHYFKVEADGVLVRDFIPVRVGSGASAVGCMYDRVSRKLFRNAGTGAFTIGPDVATPVMGLHFFKSQIKTAKDYVQTGLVAMWDGIENAGWGVHDAAATEWKNLNESGPTLTRRSSPIAWLDNALTITSASGNLGAFSVSSSAFASSVKTVEVVASFSATNNVQCIFNIGTGVSAGVGISKTGFMGAAGKTPFTSAGDDKPKSGSWLFSGGMNSSPVECYRNGISSGTGSTADVNVGNLYLTNTFVIGAVYLAYYRFVGKIHSIRLYSRILTAAEIAANYAIDKARFNLQ